MTLRHYPRGVHVVGVDLSVGMLKKAARKRDRLGMPDCHLVQADAMMPPFADETFDHVLITHVISVVSNPPLLLKWAQRLVKPGGRIVVLNHFQSTKPVVAWIEKMLNPIFLKIGWKSDLPMEDVLQGCELNVDYIFKNSMLDIWRVIVLTKRANGSSGSPRRIDEAPPAIRATPLTMM
jgi:phosphatidylethanolamine/phosphatidyl-N-methylethanolamine N-methyltransferase